MDSLVQTWPLLALPLDCSGREESPVNIACAWPTCNHAIPWFFGESRGYSAWFHSVINSLDNLPADNSSKLPSELEFVSFFTLGIEYSAYDVRGECVYSVLPLENSFWKTAGVVIKRVGMQIVDCASPYLGVNLWPKLLKSIAVSFIPTSPKNFPRDLAVFSSENISNTLVASRRIRDDPSQCCENANLISVFISNGQGRIKTCKF